MSYATWILLFAANSLFCLWVLRWGGAEWMEGWRSIFFIEWAQSLDWTAEQIKVFILACWIGHALWIVVGLFFPGARFLW
jgi:hypothetical protein